MALVPMETWMVSMSILRTCATTASPDAVANAATLCERVLPAETGRWNAPPAGHSSYTCCDENTHHGGCLVRGRETTPK